MSKMSNLAIKVHNGAKLTKKEQAVVDNPDCNGKPSSICTNYQKEKDGYCWFVAGKCPYQGKGEDDNSWCKGYMPASCLKEGAK